MIACSRMYNLNPALSSHWRSLFEHTAAIAGVPLDVIDYAAPAPLDLLWARTDLACVFMCGWPFQRATRAFQIVAAPIPEYHATLHPLTGPQYCTNLVVSDAAPYNRLQDTFGGRIAWTDRGSHSGFNAPRKLLLDHLNGQERLYSESIGPVVTPRASLNSILEGRADVAPLDSYFHSLLARHEPDTARRIRVIAQTPASPIPLLVAAPEIAPEIVAKLGQAFAQAADSPQLAPYLKDLCLSGFAIPSRKDYAVTDQWHAEAMAAGYHEPC
ncbi:MAG: PhnD/SsuA/transferrin family substrate-binding protein [Roseovarius sp.]|jgi:ABC-type phosphate/phosphonate transport system substrate-binding protein|nr:PhnD/SsuA/transferrin family substrate-binding protein [Roseovarius sp.]